MISSYPEYDKSLDFPEDEKAMELIMEAITAIRNRRAEMNVPPSKKAKLIVISQYGDSFNDKTAVFFEKMASASEVEFAESYDAEGAVSIVTDSAKLFIPMNELIDAEAEIARLTKEREKCLKDINMISGKLNNAGFVAKAPANVVEGEREKLAKAEALLANIDESIATLKA